jgi:hypothetical protein
MPQFVSAGRRDDRLESLSYPASRNTGMICAGGFRAYGPPRQAARRRSTQEFIAARWAPYAPKPASCQDKLVHGFIWPAALDCPSAPQATSEDAKAKVVIVAPR